MTTIEQNEMLAKFMGGWNNDQSTRKTGMNLPFLQDQWYDYRQMQFHSSWDWLMPIVEKLVLIDGYTCITIDNDCVFLHRKHAEMLDFDNKECGSKIAAVYKAVCAGVEWVTAKVKTI